MMIYTGEDIISVVRVIHWQKYMSRAVTKPTWVCDQHGSRPAYASTQSDQDSCCALSVSLPVIGFVSEQHGPVYMFDIDLLKKEMELAVSVQHI
jgi:hypothetical protein